ASSVTRPTTIPSATGCFPTPTRSWTPGTDSRCLRSAGWQPTTSSMASPASTPTGSPASPEATRISPPQARIPGPDSAVAAVVVGGRGLEAPHHVQVDGAGRKHLGGVLHRTALCQVQDLDELKGCRDAARTQGLPEPAVGLDQPGVHMRPRERDGNPVSHEDVEHHVSLLESRPELVRRWQRDVGVDDVPHVGDDGAV